MRTHLYGATSAFRLVSLGILILMLYPGPAVWAQQDPSVAGQFSPVYSWPSEAIHAHLLPNGRVLSWDDVTRYGTGTTDTYIVDIPTDGPPGAITEYANTYTSMFCSGHQDRFRIYPLLRGSPLALPKTGTGAYRSGSGVPFTLNKPTVPDNFVP